MVSRQEPMLQLPPLVVIVGHYGVGKTNLALNLARSQRDSYLQTGRPFTQTLIDLDIVNPYYRTSGFAKELVSSGIRLIGPVHGSSTLDTPSLMPGVDAAILEADESHPVIIDVGGDADGARALARFSRQIAVQHDHMVMYLVNSARPEVATAECAIAILLEIETTSGVKATHIANNTHLKDHTTPELILQSASYTQEIAQKTGLPVAFITAPVACAAEVRNSLAHCGVHVPVLPVDIMVGNPWEDLVPFDS